MGSGPASRDTSRSPAVVRGKIGGEISNLTDEQEVIVINLATGDPSPGIIAYQVPRERRLMAGISF